MRYLLTCFLLCMLPALTNAQALSRTQADSAGRKLIQPEFAVSAGLVFPGAVSGSTGRAEAFKGGLFLIGTNLNFNRRNHDLYFTTGLRLGLMPFSTHTVLPIPGKAGDIRHDFTVLSLMAMPGLQLQKNVGSNTLLCAGVGAGYMVYTHTYAGEVQNTPALEMSVGFMTDGKTGVGFKLFRPFNGINEITPQFSNNYHATAFMIDFRHRF